MTKRRLNLVRGSALQRIVRQSVDRALERGAEGELSELLQRELIQAIRMEAKAIQGVSRREFLDELRRSNDELVKSRDRTREELEELRRRGDLRRKQLAEPIGTAGPADDSDAAGREAEALERAGMLFGRLERGELDLDGLRVRVNALLLETARSERRGLLEALSVDHDRQVDVLERRVAKLNASLDATEKALKLMASKKDVDPGIASLFRTVQGLAVDAPLFEQKQMILESIFLANVELQAQHAEDSASEAVPAR